MEEEKDLKLEIILKTILLGILTIVISISILFFIGVSRVNADSLYGTYAYSYYPNGNQSGTKTCNEIPCELTPNKSGNIYTNNSFKIRVHTGYNASWVYQTGLNYKIIYTYYNYTLNLDTSNIKVYYINSGGTRTRIYNECSTTSNQSIRKIKIGTLEGTEKTFDINTYCSNMKVTSDQTDWEIEIPIASVQGTGAYGAMNLQIWRFTKSQVQNSTLDTDKITSNADKNADKIINNNNFNTQSIISDNDANTDRIIDNYNERMEAILTGEVWSNVSPDESAEDTLEGKEEELADYMIDNSDIQNLNFNVDTTTSQVIWTIFTNIVQSNQILFTTILTILLLGIVKLILAR